MGDVIHVVFGTEREWEQTRTRTIEGLVAVGALFGDSEELMRKKGDCVYTILRRMIEDIPSMKVTSRVPEEFSPAQLAHVTAALKEAALKGVEVTLTHCVQIMMASIYDLCTSRLAGASPS